MRRIFTMLLSLLLVLLLTAWEIRQGFRTDIIPPRRPNSATDGRNTSPF